MEENNTNSIQIIDGRMVDIDKLSSEEVDTLISKIDEKIKLIEEELEKAILENESEAI